MTDLVLSAVEYGGYISIVKLSVFLVLFFLWIPLVNWVHEDAGSVGINGTLWAGIVMGAGAIATIIWLVSPIFIVGILLYIIIVGISALVYVKQRNLRVIEFDRVLTAEHIKSLFSNSESKRLKTHKAFIFITANGNEISMPNAKTPDFFGYRSAFDIFNDAIWRRAEMIIFSPTSNGYQVRYTIDGMPVKQPSIDTEEMKFFISFVKGLADLDIKEKRKPQQGKFKISKDKDTFAWELATAGSTAGEQVRIRQMGQKGIMRLVDIGMTAEQLAQLNQIRDSEQGIFIVSGPKKSGVSTTFYALLKNHDAFLNSINSLERHITADVPDITQNTFSLSDTGTTTYAKKLRSIIRMGPDIIGISGCSDTETAQTICGGFKNGILEYITLEADSAAQAFGKWMKLVGDKDLAVDTLLGISNQRLLRNLCTECRQAYRPNPELLRKFNLPAEKAQALYRAGKVQIDKHGKEITCDDCQGTGFAGRFGVFEIILMDDELRKTLKQSKSLTDISSQFRSIKTLGLQQQALRKILDGTTAINEMIRVFSTVKKKIARKK